MREEQRLFGMRLKELRGNLGLTQEELAEKANLSSKYLSRIEMGYNFPTFKNLLKLSSALNVVEMKDLFEFSHFVGGKTRLKDDLKTLLNEADEEKLRLLVKIVRAVVK